MAVPGPGTAVAGRPWAVLATLTIAVLLVAIDATVLTLALPTLAAELEPTAAQLLWIGDIYSFVLAGLLITMGNLADRFGRRRILLLGSVAFGAASVVAAFAPTAEVLIAARALLGIGGATIMPATLSIIRTVFTDERERLRAIGIWGAAASAGSALGPVVGGVLLSHFWWGSVFLVNVPVVVVVVVVGLLVVPESRDPTPGPLDVPSVGLSFVAMIGVVAGLKRLAIDGPDVTAVGVTLLGVLSGWAFLRRQRALADPLVDPALFRDRGFSAAIASNVLAMLALSGLIFFMSLYLQLVQGLSPLAAGVRELPATLAAGVGSVVAGTLARRWTRSTVTAVGLALCSFGLVLVLGVTRGYGVLFAVLVVLGLGVGLALTITSETVVTIAPARKAGAAASISETGYEFGVALGIALLGTLLTVAYARVLVLPQGLGQEAYDRAAASLPGLAAVAAELDEPTATAVLAAGAEAFTTALHVASLVGAAIAAVGVVVAAVWLPRTRVTLS